ncbi:hypothetical protein [uncultured Gemmiger sp.]|uniref:hypothetical protein n=1 Tax=uncultured Gemmiger sp. TaxID=1623490 RepID=UPI0025EBC720|nr:hypothetical protein [uncultured Gemmiger sp.]
MQPISYMTSLFTFYLKGEIKSEQSFISFKTPNTVLGLIPLGCREERYAVNQIASVVTNSRFRLGYLVLGFFFMSGMTASPILFPICLLLAINFFVGMFQYNLVLTTTAGQVKIINFLIFDKQKANQAAEQINAMIAGRLDDTNNRQQAERIINANAQQTDRIVDAINSNK